MMPGPGGPMTVGPMAMAGALSLGPQPAYTSGWALSTSGLMGAPSQYGGFVRSGVGNGVFTIGRTADPAAEGAQMVGNLFALQGYGADWVRAWDAQDRAATQQRLQQRAAGGATGTGTGQQPGGPTPAPSELCDRLFNSIIIDKKSAADATTAQERRDMIAAEKADPNAKGKYSGMVNLVSAVKWINGPQQTGREFLSADKEIDLASLSHDERMERELALMINPAGGGTLTESDRSKISKLLGEGTPLEGNEPGQWLAQVRKFYQEKMGDADADHFISDLYQYTKTRVVELGGTPYGPLAHDKIVARLTKLGYESAEAETTANALGELPPGQAVRALKQFSDLNASDIKNAADPKTARYEAECKNLLIALMPNSDQKTRDRMFDDAKRSVNVGKKGLIDFRTLPGPLDEFVTRVQELLAKKDDPAGRAKLVEKYHKADKKKKAA